MKTDKSDLKLIEEAKKIITKSKQVKLDSTATVGSALITNEGNIYSGVCIGFFCGIGSCAEYQAIGAMISNGENKIKTVIAISENGNILPPCGKCREMIKQCSIDNLNTDVIISKDNKIKLNELLPFHYERTIEL